MEEVATTQPQQGTQVASVGEVKVEPQPTVEELRAEITRKEEVIKQTKRELSEARKRGISREELNVISERLDGVQSWMAEAMDDLVNRVTGETEPQTRKSYRQQLDERRKNQVKPEPMPDPDAADFISYMKGQGLTIEDKEVQEAIADDRTPREALKVLKAKVDEKLQATIQKEAEKKAAEKAQILYEAKLKESGMSVSGPQAPSGGGKTFTAKQIAGMTVEEFKANHEAILEAQRQGRIK